MEISKNTVIAAVRNTEDLEAALDSSSELIFDLCPNILTLGNVTEKVHKSGKKIFIHLDLADGIGKDKSGISYSRNMGADGIISTRASIIKAAKDLGLFTVQRFFIVDSQSIETTIEALRTSKTDMVEIMPGVVPKAIEQLREKLSVPIIAGGLIDSREDIEKAFCSGAIAVSTGKKELWSL